jgi:hypothetical protein
MRLRRGRHHPYFLPKSVVSANTTEEAMKKVLRRTRGLLFGVGLVGALGFGTSQAVAGTAPDKEPERARACNPICKPDCQGFGGELRGWGCLCCG